MAGRETALQREHNVSRWWRAGLSLLLERFGYDDNLYRDYRLLKPATVGFDTIPFTGSGRLNNLDWVLSLGTPQFKRFSADLLGIGGEDENFYGCSRANIVTIRAKESGRPTEKIRIDAQYQHLE